MSEADVTIIPPLAWPCHRGQVLQPRSATCLYMPIPDPFTMAGGRQYADWPDLVTCPPWGVGKVIALFTHIDPLGGQSGCPVNTELLILAPDSSQQTTHLGRGFSVSPYFLSRLVQQVHSRTPCGGGWRLVRQPQYIWEAAFNQVSLLSGLQLEPPSLHLTRCQTRVQILSCFGGPVPFLPVARAWPLFLHPSPSLATMPLHVEKSVRSGAVNSSCCNRCRIFPTLTRGEPQHPSGWSPEAPGCPLLALHRDRCTNTPWASPGNCGLPNTLASRSPPKSASLCGESPGHGHRLWKQKVLGSASSPAFHWLSDRGQVASCL